MYIHQILCRTLMIVVLAAVRGGTYDVDDKGGRQPPGTRHDQQGAELWGRYSSNSSGASLDVKRECFRVLSSLSSEIAGTNSIVW